MEQRLIDKDKLVESMVWCDEQGMILSIDDVLDIIDTAPTVDPESLRPRSYWEDVYQTGPCSFSGRCHACGVRNDIPPVEQAHYCPYCGAKMEERVQAFT